MRTINRLSCTSANAWTFLVGTAAAAAAHAQTGCATEIGTVNENANATGAAVWFGVAVGCKQYGRQQNDCPLTNQRRLSYYYRHISLQLRRVSRLYWLANVSLLLRNLLFDSLSQFQLFRDEFAISQEMHPNHPQIVSQMFYFTVFLFLSMLVSMFSRRFYIFFRLTFLIWCFPVNASGNVHFACAVAIAALQKSTCIDSKNICEQFRIQYAPGRGRSKRELYQKCVQIWPKKKQKKTWTMSERMCCVSWGARLAKKMVYDILID